MELKTVNTDGKQSRSNSIEHIKATNQIAIKMAPKRNDIVYDIEKFEIDQLEFSHNTSPLASNHSATDNDKKCQTMNKYQNTEKVTHQIKTVHTFNITISMILSVILILHGIYWDFFAHIHPIRAQRFENLQINLALCALNVLPPISIWLDIYSPFISIAAMIHCIWCLHHCFMDQPHSPNLSKLVTEYVYQNITVALLLCIFLHHSFIIIYRFNLCRTNHKIKTVLQKAVKLDIDDEQNDNNNIEINDDIEATEMVCSDLETNDIDLSLETPSSCMSDDAGTIATANNTNQSIFTALEIQKRFDLFHRNRLNGIKDDGCKYCYWNNTTTTEFESEGVTLSYLSNNNKTDENTDNAEEDQKQQKQERNEALSVTIPRSTRQHAVPCIQIAKCPMYV